MKTHGIHMRVVLVLNQNISSVADNAVDLFLSSIPDICGAIRPASVLSSQTFLNR